ncbi:putative protein BCP1 [Cryptosporidium felis]|nr:putative protein BCP1 [Cryptosporidium felis]
MAPKRKLLDYDTSEKNCSQSEPYNQKLLMTRPNNLSIEKKMNDEVNSSSDESTIDGEFDFNDPNENDYHSVKNLLLSTQYTNLKNIEFHEFVDIICNQGNIGTTVSISESIIAISTIINFRQYWHVMDKISEFIQESLSKNNKSFEEFFSSVVKSKNVGLFVNERLKNAPPQIAPVLCRCLLDDVQWTLDNLYTDIPREEREYYSWDYIFMYTVRYISTGNKPTIVYLKHEEEELISNSIHSAMWQGNKEEWRITDENNEMEYMKQQYVLSIIEFEKFKELCKKAE